MTKDLLIDKYINYMTNSVSISQLKINPARIIKIAEDYPVAIKKRNSVSAYLLGKEIYEKIIFFLENVIDKKAIVSANFKKKVSFEKVAKKLNI